MAYACTCNSNVVNYYEQYALLTYLVAPTLWMASCMITSSNGTFSCVTVLCAGNSPITGEFSSQRPVTRSYGIFFDLRPNKRMSKQSWGWWFETPSRSLWRHCNVSVLVGGRSKFLKSFNISGPRKITATFAGGIFRTNFLDWNPLRFDSNFAEFVPYGPIYNKPVLVQIMAWRRTEDIIWTNGDSVYGAYMPHPASVSLSNILNWLHELIAVHIQMFVVSGW